MYFLYFFKSIERIALKSFLNLTFGHSDISFCWMCICSSIGHILLFPCLSVIWVIWSVANHRTLQGWPGSCAAGSQLSAPTISSALPGSSRYIHPLRPFHLQQPLFLSLESWVSFADYMAEHSAKGLSRVCPLTFQIPPDLVLCLLS